nr:uncharacterized protein LOC117855342 isoform X1 [Setaria viridis]XP_034593560.1 uncharacterized protein LOC117855342 isoform X1 [Setaria viridis]XP_034593561.1 uncharacterized protein LOC117855342 isoform X1 [Setaria viridis]
MASPPPGPPSWSVAVRLRHRWGLDIRAAAENVLPGWGRGGERLSLLLRFRRRLILTVTSQCGARPAAAPTQPGTPPRGGKILRFLRSRWARLPRITSIWRRKKHTPTRAAAAAAAAAPRGRRAQVIPSPVFFLGEPNADAARLLGNGRDTDLGGDAAVVRRRRRGRGFHRGLPHHDVHRQLELEGRTRRRTDCPLGEVLGVDGASSSLPQVQVVAWRAQARIGMDLQQVEI